MENSKLSELSFKLTQLKEIGKIDVLEEDLKVTINKANAKFKPFVSEILSQGGYVQVLVSDDGKKIQSHSLEGIDSDLRAKIYR